ncbi:MAG: CapA family protein [Agathobacter sp.]|nr:CapA family protein [Agathobacter sp.]
MARIKEERRKKKQKRIVTLILGSAGVSIFAISILVFIVASTLGGNTGNSVSKGERDSQPSQYSEPLNNSELESVLTQETEESEILSEEPPQELQIVMVGDMLMHSRLIDSGLKADGTYNFDHLFVNVQEFIQAADIAIVNQETIMGGKELGYSGYPRFNSPYELADAEVKAGFNVILHATNHTTDKGKEAVLNCMNYWDTNYPDIAYLGINKTQEEQDNNIYVFEQNGIKVAILNYTYTLNGNRMPSDMPYLVNLMTKGVSEEKVIADIKKAEEIADFTIVCPHWGTEYKLTVSSTQEYWTEIFLENGVDLVMGAHPHVIEPIEWVTDEDGNRMLVYYSLGNYVNGTSSTKGNLAQRMVGGIADVTIGRNEAGEVVILEHDVVPIVCHIDEGDAYTVYYLEDYTAEMAQENRIRLQDSAFSLDACWDVVHQVWGEE